MIIRLQKSMAIVKSIVEESFYVNTRGKKCKLQDQNSRLKQDKQILHSNALSLKVFSLKSDPLLPNRRGGFL